MRPGLTGSCVVVLAGILASCQGSGERTEAPRAAATLPAPRWAADAIWYQIMVERFRNGDRSNDPTAHDIEGFTATPAPPGWKVTPWGADWYRQDPWATANRMEFYTAIQYRRYGGDLQGVLDRLDYIQSLGATAIFLNPINDAPSLHKYDARNYHHIDRNFGPDPRGDEALLAQEDPGNPATWKWSAADSLFLKLVQEVHRRGMRIIIDYSWNHTGTQFWAWQDILKNQAKSKYADWYTIERFDDPATRDTNEFAYRGWAGVPWLPEWKKVGRPAGQEKGAIEGNLVDGVKQHVFAVTRRWMDPNQDGNPADGVDGFRLDVAEMVPLGFWREYRRYVRSLNPEAYLVGEIWWEQWPDRMYDPAPWMQGDVFDAVMHYQWFAPTRRALAGAEPALPPAQYRAAYDGLGTGIRPEFQRVQMNLTASHDTPRFGTSIYNPGPFKYHANPREDSTYRVDRPDERSRGSMKLILVQQFTGIGAPHIWNGDEVGMWGADDPDERKPVVWSDLRYEDEVVHPFGRSRHRDVVTPDTALLRFYKSVVALRKEHLQLFVDGAMEWLAADDSTGVLVYRRTLGDQSAVVAFNTSEQPRAVTLPGDGAWRVALATVPGSIVALKVPARSAVVWLRP
ncbi:MAG: glycoside hydrolase family 13 protein [Gemmatimonadales bacterium]